MKWQDLTWWEHTPESFFGQDKKGNVYGINYKTGEIELRPDVTIDIMWFGANDNEVERELAKAKEYAEKNYGIKPNQQKKAK
jgi:hypothetical protein